MRMRYSSRSTGRSRSALCMIEAMACGTPVLAFRCGSVPEIVEDGLSGVIVDTMEDAIAALPRVIALDRKTVRQRFEQRFPGTRMAKDYLRVYRSLLASSKSKTERNTQLLLSNGKHANGLRAHIASEGLYRDPPGRRARSAAVGDGADGGNWEESDVSGQNRHLPLPS